MKDFFSKYGFALVFGLFCLMVICLVINSCFDNYIATLKNQFNTRYEYVTENTSCGKMISRWNNGMESTPISAKIKNHILVIEAELKNSTGTNLMLKNYSILEFGGYEFAADVIFDGDGTLNNGATLKVTYKVNVSNLKTLKVLPTTTTINLGATDVYNNYREFELEYITNWS